MSFLDSIRVAIEALAANKLRACLTMLGMVIGVGAVIALMAVGRGSQKAVQDKIAGLGANLIFIEPGSLNQGGLQGGQGTARTLTAQDGEALIANVPGVVDAVSEMRDTAQLSFGGTNTFTRLLGVSPDYGDVLSLKLADGEFFSSFDNATVKPVAVLGASLAKTLFGDSEPVGERIRMGLGRNSYVYVDIVGVLAAGGGAAADSKDTAIYLPFALGLRRLSPNELGPPGATPIRRITVQVIDKSHVAGVKKSITDFLIARHKVQSADFDVTTQDDIAATANAVNSSMTVLLGAIAGISLIVGGIGIMNIMLVSVTERTREIGIRKAVGARRNDILMQFLTEAVTVTMMGGLIGIAAGLGTAAFLNGRSIAGLGDHIQTLVSWPSVAAAFAVSAAIGIFFGLYPAQRAARLTPIDALRYE